MLVMPYTCDMSCHLNMADLCISLRSRAIAYVDQNSPYNQGWQSTALSMKYCWRACVQAHTYTNSPGQEASSRQARTRQRERRQARRRKYDERTWEYPMKKGLDKTSTKRDKKKKFCQSPLQIRWNARVRKKYVGVFWISRFVFRSKKSSLRRSAISITAALYNGTEPADSGHSPAPIAPIAGVTHPTL
jgi:hypothetical protein